jgi:hypothetical protein
MSEGNPRQPKTPIPLPRTTDTPSTSHCVGRVSLASVEASVSPPDESTISYHHSVASRSSPFPSKQAAGSNSDASKHNCCCIAALLASCCHRTRLQTLAIHFFFKKLMQRITTCRPLQPCPTLQAPLPSHTRCISTWQACLARGAQTGGQKKGLYMYILYLFLFFILLFS